MAAVRTDGNLVAGETFSMECYITRAKNVTSDIFLRWIGPDGRQVISQGLVVVGIPTTSGSITSLTLKFATLYSSNGGQYSCQSNLTYDDEGYSVSVTSDVIVQGISFYFVIIVALTNIVVFSIVVPAPTINISRLPIDQLYTGTTLILTYTFELNGAVDTEVTGKEILYSQNQYCLLYTSPSPRDATLSRMPSSA